jgi:2,5-diamino-6-(ribosylamino)-4(3H)-pyrimidinone 5'-phosphate reductase
MARIDAKPCEYPYVVAHLAIALDGSSSGFAPNLAEFYRLSTTWNEDVTLAGAETILAQEDALASAPAGPGPNPAGPLLAVVDSRSRVREWTALSDAGHWRGVVRLQGPHPGEPVDLAAALRNLATAGAKTVRVDSGGRLIIELLQRGLLDELSLLIHPCMGSGRPWSHGLRRESIIRLLHHERRESDLIWIRYAVSANPT